MKQGRGLPSSRSCALHASGSRQQRPGSGRGPCGAAARSGREAPTAREMQAPGDRGGPWFPLSATRGIAAARGIRWCWPFRPAPLRPPRVGRWKPGECSFRGTMFHHAGNAVIKTGFRREKANNGQHWESSQKAVILSARLRCHRLKKLFPREERPEAP